MGELIIKCKVKEMRTEKETNLRKVISLALLYLG